MAECPPNSVPFNSTLCACNPGYVLNVTSKACDLFRLNSAEDGWIINSGVDYSMTFPETIFSFNSIRKFTQSQALFLEATFVMLVAWLLLCIFVRFMKVEDGRSVWFKIRWWISRLDVCYATRHWLDDHKFVKKRKTELGGTFSVASCILFLGLFAALLYQIISRRSIEVHNVRATNGPDLLSFVNDMEFNITTISSMSCSQLRGLGSIVRGTPASIDYKVSPLSVFANYSCHNTSRGPTISLKCSNCHIARDDMYISWQFVDLPNSPATAVGFHFNFTARSIKDKKHVSFVSGTVKNGSLMDDRPVTFRGSDVNILKVHLFPRIYHNFHDLRLIQPLFHEFRPGSSFLEASQLQASLLSSKDGLVNASLFLDFLSAYILEIDNDSLMGPVTFLADLGGLYAISFIIFFYFLVQCEYRVKKLRDEDNVLRNIRNRKIAQEHWDKLRKYVIYTWGCSSLDHTNIGIGDDPLCGCVGGVGGKAFHRARSHHKRKHSIQMDTISLNQKTSVTPTKHTQNVKSRSLTTAPNLEMSIPHSEGEQVGGHEVSGIKVDGGSERSVNSSKVDSYQHQERRPKGSTILLPPVPEIKPDSTNDASDVQKNLQNLYEYNVMLREKFILAQSMLEDLTKKVSDPQNTSNK